MKAPPFYLLLLNGEIPRPELVLKFARASRGVFCADGGLRHAIALGLEPLAVIGDMDSRPRKLPAWKRTTYWCDFAEDRSDFEKALGFALQVGVKSLGVAGALGGRLDHALINLAVLERFSAKLELTLLDQGLGRLCGVGRYRLDARKGDTFSLLASGKAARISLSGAKYPLARASLPAGSGGLSNQATGPVTLTVHSGKVWALTGCRRT